MPWSDTYAAILAEFGWSEADDMASAKRLQGLVPRGGWRHVGTELKHRPEATIVGCSQALDDLSSADLHGIVIAADGATARLQELGVVPRVVVTDLDGDEDALRWAAAQGSSIVVHAHGDNQDRLAIVPELGPFVAGTCQCDAAGLEPLRNLGGFTDGDRAALLAKHMGVRSIHLAAFDFDGAPSRFSHRFDPAIKARKLAWAKQILGEHGLV